MVGPCTNETMTRHYGSKVLNFRVYFNAHQKTAG